MSILADVYLCVDTYFLITKYNRNMLSCFDSNKTKQKVKNLIQVFVKVTTLNISYYVSKNEIILLLSMNETNNVLENSMRIAEFDFGYQLRFQFNFNNM